MKDLMQHLHKDVYARFKDGRDYSFKVAMKLKKAGLSEISIYNKFAEHIVENELNPETMIDDLEYFLRGVADNIMIMKNEDRFSWLYKSFNDLKWSGFDEKHFICTRCHRVFNIKEKSTSLKACRPCFSEYNKESYELNKDKPKKPKKKDPELEHVEKLPEKHKKRQEDDTEAQEIAQQLKALIETQSKAKEFGQFMRINDLITEPSKGKVTAMIEVDFNRLIDLLTIVNPYLKEQTDNEDNRQSRTSETDPEAAGETEAFTE